MTDTDPDTYCDIPIARWNLAEAGRQAATGYYKEAQARATIAVAHTLLALIQQLQVQTAPPTTTPTNHYPPPQ